MQSCADLRPRLRRALQAGSGVIGVAPAAMRRRSMALRMSWAARISERIPQMKAITRLQRASRRNAFVWIGADVLEPLLRRGRTCRGRTAKRTAVQMMKRAAGLRAGSRGEWRL